MNKEQSLFEQESGWSLELLETIENELKELVKLNLEQKEQAAEDDLFPENREHVKRDDKIYEISFDSGEDKNTHELDI